MRELIIKKCLKCGAIVKIIKDCNCSDCGIQCCKESMKEIKPNSADAAIEKHKPTYEINKDMISVNVEHVMEQDHYIEWICFITDKEEKYIYLNPGDTFPIELGKYEKGIIYSYCNKHGLWKTEIN